MLLGLPSMAVELTQDIENNSSNDYTDQVVRNIKAVPKGEKLEVEICSGGGDVYQGARILFAILNHEGPTKASVIGLAASMSSKLLGAFDEVEIDSEASLMYHKAHIKNVDKKDYTPGMDHETEKFNNQTYDLLLNKGVDKDFLQKVYKSDSTEDYWLTAKEAEQLGIGKAVKIERRDSKPFKVAASLDINQIKNQFKEQMGLFSKEATQVVNLEDGRMLAFTSKKKELEKGNTVNLVGSGEKLNGTFKLANNMVATVENNEVVNMEEEEKTPQAMDDEKYNELYQTVEDMKETIKEIVKKMGGDVDEKEAEMKAKEEEELQAKKDEQMKNIQEGIETASNLLSNAMKVASTIKGGTKLPKIDDKHEGLQDPEYMKNLSTSERHALDMRNVLNGETVATQEKEK